MKLQFQNKDLIIFESELFRTTTTLINAKDYILLVDPNWLPREIEFIKSKADELGKGKEKYLLFTHSDYDHIIGYEKFKEYKTIASLNFVENDGKEKVLNDIKKFDDEYYIQRDYNIVFPKIDIVIDKDKMMLQIKSDQYIFYQARGHNKDGIITYNSTKGIVIAGDYLSNIEFPYVYDSFQKYINTLAKFATIINSESINILIPGHGDFTNSIEEMKQRILDSYNYIEELETSVTKGITFNLQKLFSTYKFPIGMTKFHNENIKLMKKENLE